MLDRLPARMTERSFSLSLSLHMRVARQTPPNRQKLCTLFSANSTGGSAAGRSATLDPSVRKYVPACAVSSTRSSWVLHRRTACGLHCPFQTCVMNADSNQGFAAAARATGKMAQAAGRSRGHRPTCDGEQNPRSRYRTETVS